MIEGREVIFGTGDIRICPIHRDDFAKGGVILKQQEPHEIGEKISNVDFPMVPEESDVIISFTNPKSIDVLINQLLSVKDCLENQETFKSSTKYDY